MFLHIVMMRIDEGVGEPFFEQVNACAERVKAECGGLLMFHFGPNSAERAGGYNYVTSSAFVDEAAHDAYQVSPAHTEMKVLMAPHIESVVVYDGVVPAI